LTIILAGVLRQLAYLNEFTVFVLMGVVAIAVAWLLLRGQTAGAPAHGEASLRERFGPHIDYARWAVPTSALTWAPANLPYLVLPIWGGLSTSGDFRALTTLVMPMLQTNYALGQMLLPGFSRHRGRSVLVRTVRTAYVGTVGLALMFWVAIAVAGTPLLEWLYGGKYSGVSEQIIVIGALPILTGVVTVQQALIRARQQPRLVFWAYAAATLSSVAIGTPLTYWFGLRGAIAGVLVSYGVLAAILWRVSSINDDQGRADEGS
jgi:O-antigen/teichoic acid export membrane protein